MQKSQPTGAAYAQAREQEKQRKKAIRDHKRAAEVATREEDAELAAQMKASARLNGEVRPMYSDCVGAAAREWGRAGGGILGADGCTGGGSGLLVGASIA